MTRALTAGFVILLAVVAFVAANSLFIVHQTQYALVLRFGEVRKTIVEPGLKVKTPIIETVEFIDKRILGVDSQPQLVIASDKKQLVVDAFARYRIVDPVKFFQAVSTEVTARSRLQQVLTSELRNTLGGQTFSAVLSDRRAALMLLIRDQANDQSSKWGIEVVDVRIRRADLPEANSQAIYSRMQTERQQEAAEIRAQGAEESLRIRSRADRDVTVLLAEARREAEIIRGQGDGERNRIYGEAYNQDAEFFSFYRSMLAYQEAIKQGDTTMVLDPRSEFFRYFGQSGAR